MVVFTGLHRFDWATRSFEIGYWVRKDEQGKGYATENTNALTRYAFNALNANRVEIHHAEGNDASRAVIEKLGFEHEVTRKINHSLPDGSLVDDYSYVRFDTKGLPELKVEWGIEP